MARLLVFVLALCAVGGAFADPRDNLSKLDPEALKPRQMQLLILFLHNYEPSYYEMCESEPIKSKCSIENNYEHYSNVTAAKTYNGMLKNNWILPRGVPFSVDEPAHAFEAMTLFHVLYSAKDFETFFYTAVYLRDIINEDLFFYVLSISIIYRPDTQGLTLPPSYEIFPQYYNNAEIMATAQRLNVQGQRFIKHYPSTYVWDDYLVIKSNATTWPYYDNNFAISYFTNDYELNAAQYYSKLLTPFWMGGTETPIIGQKIRGEALWYGYRQLVARYYMERLSNGLGEIPEITNIVKDGFTSGLLYNNGIPFPSRPNNFRLDQPELATAVKQVTEYEDRIWEAIDKGFYLNRKGEHVNLLTEEGLDILGNLIESNADSPNRHYYKDFIRIWKKILGNSIKSGYQYNSHFTPLVAPSALENYQTSLRDPAYYLILKRVLNLFVYWQKQMPLYRPEDLSLPAVSIEKVETDKLVTYFENTYINVTNALYLTNAESKTFYKDVKVLVQHARLNHKPFSIRVNVKSEVAKKVLVKFFLAPKYDSKGFEIPLHLNTENFFMLDQFPYDLPAGESVITRKSTDYLYTMKELPGFFETLKKVDDGEWAPARRSLSIFPHHLLLPKGKVGGMKFQLLAFIQEFDGFKPAYTPGYDITGYPTNRPLYSFQVKNVKNMFFQDVVIYHKEVPEVYVPLNA